MIKPTNALTELVEKTADADLLKRMIQFIAQRMMEFGVEGLCSAGFDVKSLDRVPPGTATEIASGKVASAMWTYRPRFVTAYFRQRARHQSVALLSAQTTCSVREYYFMHMHISYYYKAISHMQFKKP